MVERTYRFELVVWGDVVYSSTIERTSPLEALNWGFYWMPTTWIKRERSNTGGIFARIAIVREYGQGPYSFYTNYLLNDAAHIRGFDDDDLMHLMAGQDLSWMIVDRDGHFLSERVFGDYEAAEHYMSTHDMAFTGYARPVWVDDWASEQWSWEIKDVKGYEGCRLHKDRR